VFDAPPAVLRKHVDDFRHSIVGRKNLDHQKTAACSAPEPEAVPEFLVEIREAGVQVLLGRDDRPGAHAFLG
jgi:hypothetical protein